MSFEHRMTPKTKRLLLLQGHLETVRYISQLEKAHMAAMDLVFQDGCPEYDFAGFCPYAEGCDFLQALQKGDCCIGLPCLLEDDLQGE